MLGIHQIQAPFAAQFGPSAQGGQLGQMVSDVNKATQSHADHLRKLEEIKARQKPVRPTAIEPVDPESELLRREDDQTRLARLIERLGEASYPMGGGVLR